MAEIYASLIEITHSVSVVVLIKHYNQVFLLVNGYERLLIPMNKHSFSKITIYLEINKTL